MRYIFVLHTGQEPVVAGLPFFMTVGVAFCISRFCLHFRQYASIRCTSLSCLAAALPPLPYRSTFVEPGSASVPGPKLIHICQRRLATFAR